MKRFFRTKRGIALTYMGRLLLLGALILSIVTHLQVEAHPYVTKPLLGTASSFAVLGGSTVTNTGPTVVTGNLGVSPGSAVTGFPPGLVNGTIHAADAVALQAQNDMATAYVNAAGQPCAANLTNQDLGGKTLTSGVYCFASSAQLTGPIILNGQGDPASVFIFQIGSSLVTASNSSVLLTNDAQSCNVFWQVGSSATIGTNASFAGNILALSSITFTTGATSNGSLYAHNAAVTLDTNTITQSPCTTPTPVVTLTPPVHGPVRRPVRRPILPPPFPGTPFPPFPGTPFPPFPGSPFPPFPGSPFPPFPGTPFPPFPGSPFPPFPGSPFPQPVQFIGRPPELSITKSHNKSGSGDDLLVGQKVIYTLTATNAQTAGPVINPITVSDITQSGETNLRAFGPGWQVTMSSTTSPAIIVATFVGPLPVNTGASLPPLTITATLTEDAVPSITDTATVSTPGNLGIHNTATDTVFVDEQSNNHQHINNRHHQNSSNNDQGRNHKDNLNHRNSHNHANNNGGRPRENDMPGMPLTGEDPT